MTHKNSVFFWGGGNQNLHIWPNFDYREIEMIKPHSLKLNYYTEILKIVLIVVLLTFWAMFLLHLDLCTHYIRH